VAQGEDFTSRGDPVRIVLACDDIGANKPAVIVVEGRTRISEHFASERGFAAPVGVHHSHNGRAPGSPTWERAKVIDGSTASAPAAVWGSSFTWHGGESCQADD